jgi:predicted NAD/FAD-binding protein
MKQGKIRNIAIIGSSLAGLTSAYILNSKYRITLYDTSDTIGGIYKSSIIDVGQKKVLIDIVEKSFNYSLNPYLVKLLAYLHIRLKPIKSSFSLSFEKEYIEFNNMNINEFLKKYHNLFNINFYRMKKDIEIFNSAYLKYKHSNILFKDFVEKFGFREYFIRYYLMPLISIVLENKHIMDMKMSKIFYLLDTIGLFDFNMDEQYVIDGGVDKLIDGLQQGINIKKVSTIKEVQRMRDKVLIDDNNTIEYYDKVIFASHPQEFLPFVKDIEDKEYKVLSYFNREDNTSVIHTSTDFMPIERKNWAIYNYKGNTYDGDICLGNTIWLNDLLNKDTQYPLFLSENIRKDIDFYYGKYMYKYPIFQVNTPKFQDMVIDLQDYNNCFYIGSYLYEGRLEDEISSAIHLCHKLDTKEPWIEDTSIEEI